VEQMKQSRQSLISAVEKVVHEKSTELPAKNAHQSSWLVYKLNRQIYELKLKIEQKEKTIKTLKLNKENEQLRYKQTEVECLDEILQWAEKSGLT